MQRHPTKFRDLIRRGGRVLAAGLIGAFGLPGLAAANLKWDLATLEVRAREGDESVPFAFRFTNTAAAELTIRAVTPSCGCTWFSLPPLPWKVLPGATETLTGTLDVHGKVGDLTKTIVVQTSRGKESQEFHVVIAMSESRSKNILRAQADRQAVFAGECASCHATPGEHQTGLALYTAVCAVCHQSERRASMVPVLALRERGTDPAYWTDWIRRGREGSLMPAFARSAGGPLDEAQIQSLVQGLVFQRQRGCWPEQLSGESSPPDSRTPGVTAPSPKTSAAANPK